MKAIAADGGESPTPSSARPPREKYSTLIRILGCLLLLVVAYRVFFVYDLDPRPAQRAEGVEQLAERLDAGGIDCTLRLQESAGSGEEWGGCADPDDPLGYSLQFAVYSDPGEYEDELAGARDGCGGAFVYGPNWWVGPAESRDAEAILGAVGGRVVGNEMANNC